MSNNPYQPPESVVEPRVQRGFVQRSFVGDQEQVVLRYLAIYHWLRFPVIGIMLWAAATSAHSQLAVGIAIAAWVVLVALGFPYWSINREVKQRMAVQAVTIQGSRYSFSNPITYRWDRTPADITR